MSTGQALGAVVGGAIGFFVGGPTGALYGAQIGIAAGGYLDPPKGPTVSGPRLGDKSVQTSTYGTMLPRFYGTIGVSGNITWLENNQLKEHVRKKKSGGKGGGSSATTKIYTYSATFFLSLGLGPIAGVRRIWCGDRLIYNAGSDDLETIIASNQNAAGFKVYLGTDDQLPDPRYEADVGVGNASAYRGEAYIAFYDFQLADYGNTLQGAQFKVEVIAFGDPEQVLGVGSVEALGPSGSPFESSSAYMLATDGSSIIARQTGLDMFEDRIGTSGRVETRLIGPATTYTHALGGDIDSPGTVLLSGGGGVQSLYVADDVYSLPAFTANQGSLVFRRHGEMVVTKELAGSTYIYVVDVDNGDILASTAYPALVSLALTDAGTLVGIKSDHVTVVTFSLADLSVIDTFVLSWSPPVASYRTAYSVGDRLYYLLLSGASVPTVLVISLSEKLAVDQYVLPIPPGGMSPPGLRLTVRYGLLAVFRKGSSVDNPSAVFYFKEPWGGSGPIPLADVIEREAELSSLLTAADIDTNLLTDQVRGYRVSGGSIRSALEPLQGAFPFDIIPSGYQIKAVPRGQASVMAIPWQDLGATDGDTPGDLLQESREMDSQLPARTSIKYLDAAREYAVAEQYSERLNTQAINRVDRELPMVLTADEAAGVAEVLNFLPWLERSEYAFSLPPTYLALEPADVVTVTAPWAIYELRLTEVNYAPAGRLECKATPNRAALYTSNAKGGEGVPPAGTITLPGNAVTALLDIPLIRNQDSSPQFAAAMASTGAQWPGGSLFRSPDNEQTWDDVQAWQSPVTMGSGREALAVHDGLVLDRSSTLRVDLLAGELESITEAQMMTGLHWCAYGADQRWEILRFASAVLQSDGSYLLSTLLRGLLGTEWATGLHQYGDRFVLLDDVDVMAIGADLAVLNVVRKWRGVSAGQSIDDMVSQDFAYRGVNLKPLSGVNGKAVRVANDWTITWSPRTRLQGSLWKTGVALPVGEATKSYQGDVMNGTTVVRTLSATTEIFTYTSAQQIADFGSVQSTITINVYQLSADVGRGYSHRISA